MVVQAARGGPVAVGPRAAVHAPQLPHSHACTQGNGSGNGGGGRQGPASRWQNSKGDAAAPPFIACRRPRGAMQRQPDSCSASGAARRTDGPEAEGRRQLLALLQRQALAGEAPAGPRRPLCLHLCPRLSLSRLLIQCRLSTQAPRQAGGLQVGRRRLRQATKLGRQWFTGEECKSLTHPPYVQCQQCRCSRQATRPAPRLTGCTRRFLRGWRSAPASSATGGAAAADVNLRDASTSPTSSILRLFSAMRCARCSSYWLTWGCTMALKGPSGRGTCRCRAAGWRRAGAASGAPSPPGRCESAGAMDGFTGLLPVHPNGPPKGFSAGSRWQQVVLTASCSGDAGDRVAT